MELDSIQTLGPSEDANSDGAELLGGAQKQPSLEGPPGDLDDCTAFWDEPDGSGHVGGAREPRSVPAWGLLVIFLEVQAKTDLLGIPEEARHLKYVKRFGQL